MTPYCKATARWQTPPTQRRTGPVTVTDVIWEAARRFRVSVADLTGPSRTRPLVHYRHAAMAACRLLTGASYPMIAKAFGNRDHTTVMYSCRKAEAGRFLADLLAVWGDDDRREAS